MESLRCVAEEEKTPALDAVEVVVDHRAEKPFVSPQGVEPKEVVYRSDLEPGTELKWECSDPLHAPEEDLIPDLCSFSDSLHYMEMSVEEAEAEFLRDMPSRVNKEFADSTDVCAGVASHKRS